mgnify:CR=1 FL=1
MTLLMDRYPVHTPSSDSQPSEKARLLWFTTEKPPEPIGYVSTFLLEGDFVTLRLMGEKRVQAMCAEVGSPQTVRCQRAHAHCQDPTFRGNQNSKA